MVLFAVILVLVLTGSERAVAYSSGAPVAACSTLTPGHPFASQDPPGGYYIYSSLIDNNGGVYTPGTTYTRENTAVHVCIIVNSCLFFFFFRLQ